MVRLDAFKKLIDKTYRKSSRDEALEHPGMTSKHSIDPPLGFAKRVDTIDSDNLAPDAVENTDSYHEATHLIVNQALKEAANHVNYSTQYAYRKCEEELKRALSRAKLITFSSSPKLNKQCMDGIAKTASLILHRGMKNLNVMEDYPNYLVLERVVTYSLPKVITDYSRMSSDDKDDEENVKAFISILETIENTVHTLADDADDRANKIFQSNRIYNENLGKTYSKNEYKAIDRSMSDDMDKLRGDMAKVSGDIDTVMKGKSYIASSKKVIATNALNVPRNIDPHKRPNF